MPSTHTIGFLMQRRHAGDLKMAKLRWHAACMPRLMRLQAARLAALRGSHTIMTFSAWARCISSFSATTTTRARHAPMPARVKYHATVRRTISRPAARSAALLGLQVSRRAVSRPMHGAEFMRRRLRLPYAAIYHRRGNADGSKISIIKMRAASRADDDFSRSRSPPARPFTFLNGFRVYDDDDEWV